MNRLKEKNIYYIITGASKAEYADKIIKEMISEGAKIFTIPTKSGMNFVDVNKLKKIKKNIVKIDWNEKIKLPEEDAILIAPCTFNTLNSIAYGIANSYPLCLVASAIGNKTPIFIAPAMNKSLWENPVVQESMKKLELMGCNFVWPKITSDEVTMMDTGKILDTLYFNFKRINFNSNQNNSADLKKKLLDYRNKYFKKFKAIGKFLKINNLNLPTAGCVSIKVPEGFLISSSGCDLSDIDITNISLVVFWSEKLNSIEWVGDFAPSSESPLHCIIHSNNKNNIILHVHCPKITYAYGLDDFASEKYCRYGTFEIGRQMLRILDKNNFSIMKYHGEIVIGNSVKELEDILLNFIKLT